VKQLKAVLMQKFGLEILSAIKHVKFRVVQNLKFTA